MPFKTRNEKLWLRIFKIGLILFSFHKIHGLLFVPCSLSFVKYSNVVIWWIRVYLVSATTSWTTFRARTSWTLSHST
jgi:hypothetical protein